MKRRLFVKASVLTGSLSSLISMESLASKNPDGQQTSNQEFYELRVYTVRNETQQKLVENYFQKAAIPGYNRLGNKNIGVFTELKPTGQTKLYVIIPFKTLEEFLTVQEKLSNDAAYKESGTAYLDAPATEPAYERIESSLLMAFTNMPEMEVPQKKSRLFELRRYESAGESAGKKKIEMFNNVGEIDIFKRVGLTPVFLEKQL